MDKVSEEKIEKLAGELKKLAAWYTPAVGAVKELWAGTKALGKTTLKGYERGTMRGSGGILGGLKGAGRNVKGYFGFNAPAKNMEQMRMFNRRRAVGGGILGAGALGSSFMAGRMSKGNNE